jgi:hypothetical protein
MVFNAIETNPVLPPPVPSLVPPASIILALALSALAARQLAPPGRRKPETRPELKRDADFESRPRGSFGESDAPACPGMQLSVLLNRISLSLAGQYIRPTKQDPTLFSAFPANSNVRASIQFDF